MPYRAFGAGLNRVPRGLASAILVPALLLAMIPVVSARSETEAQAGAPQAGASADQTRPTDAAAQDQEGAARSGTEATATLQPETASPGEPRQPWEDAGRPKRPHPMGEQELLNFLETVVHAQALDRKCDLFNRDDKAMLYLSYQWGRSIATNPTYPPWLFLTVIEYQGEYDRRLEPVKCSHPSMRRLRRQFQRFLEQAGSIIRMEEVEIGGFHER